MPLGVYISIPFCRSKCSYCNFASGVFSGAMFGSYVDRVCDDISRAGEIALKMQGHLEREVETIYLGGGTPTVLAPADGDDLSGRGHADRARARRSGARLHGAEGEF